MKENIEIENLISSTSNRFEAIKKEQKEHKAMLDSIFDNDTELKNLELQITKLQKLKKIAKQKILKEGEPLRLAEKITEYKHQVKEIKMALSDYLSQYVAKFDTNQIELADGVVRQIIHSAKLVKLS